MRDIQLPRVSTHSWRDFFLHIGTIAVGLLLALGLEQLVLAVHHRQQREDIEQQMRTVLQSDLEFDSKNFQRLESVRAYLSELKTAINARLQGGARLPQPAATILRTNSFIRYPNLAPYEVAKQNGTAALLPTVRLRQYARLALVRDYLLTDRVSFTQTMAELEGFQKRYGDYRGTSTMGAETVPPDLDHLTASELIEYRALLGRAIEWIDFMYARLDLVDLEIRALLSGALTEEELLDSSVRARPHGFGVPAPH
jgi:hypothetical protein